ncbi:MAG: aldose 1-epimerase [Chloroflexota bacterium]|nr:aldose 1-epimerase [Chloroflexota bacterium]
MTLSPETASPDAPTPPSAGFAEREGERIVVLREPASGSLAEVVPRLGSNVTRFRTLVEGRPIDVIGAPPDLATLRGLPTRYGAGVLFPYPGRVAGDGFDFQGRRVHLPPDPATNNAMHGLARRRAWRVTDMGASPEAGAWVTTEIATREEAVTAAEWPFPFRLSLRATLRGGRLRSDVTVANTGDVAMPFGLGFHPYIPTPLGPRGDADACEVEIGATERWRDFIEPPATVTPVAEDEWPRRPLPLADIAPVRRSAAGIVRNATFFRRGPDGGRGATGRLIDRANGVEAVVTCSPEFRAMVFYTPPGIATASLEPHTCIPNAFNLTGAGRPDPGLVVVAPGATWQGWYTLHAVPLRRPAVG